MGFPLRGPFPSNEFVVQVIAERAIGAEPFLVKQPLGAAAQANLIGTSLHSDRPAHTAVPAASEGHHGRPSQAGGHDSGPPPAGFLEFFGAFSARLRRSLIVSFVVTHRSSHLRAFLGRLFLGLLLHHRTNRGGGQNLKGRSWRHCRLRQGMVGIQSDRNRTCTNGHCGTHLKTITLEVGVVPVVPG